MAVKASPEIIREMKQDISRTARDLERISNGIKSGVSSTAGWDDSQAEQFRAIMQRIARATETPVSTLNAALPKLERLAQSLDEYGRVRF